MLPFRRSLPRSPCHAEDVRLAYQNAHVIADDHILPLQVDGDRRHRLGKRLAPSREREERGAAAQWVEPDDVLLLDVAR